MVGLMSGTKEQCQALVLEYLGVTRWHARKKRQGNTLSAFKEVEVSTNKLSVILLFLGQKNRVFPLINAMFLECDVLYFEQGDVNLEKNIASSAIIIYDECLTLKNLLDESLHDRCFALSLSNLDRADIKKQTMMNIYAVSDFAIR